MLGEQLKLRQQVIASATVFFKRFYSLNSLNTVDPLLMAPTCVFLASKVNLTAKAHDLKAQSRVYSHSHNCSVENYTPLG